MSIIDWIVIGAVAGWLASMLLGRNDELGWMANILVGILGAVVGGLGMHLIGGSGVDGSSGSSILAAVGGALLLLFAFNLNTLRSGRTGRTA